MRYINLKQEVIQHLQEIIKTDKKHKSRMRAQALLLSNQGKRVTEIVEIIGYSQRTLYRWFDRFHQDNINTVHELVGVKFHHVVPFQKQYFETHLVKS